MWQLFCQSCLEHRVAFPCLVNADCGAHESRSVCRRGLKSQRLLTLSRSEKENFSEWLKAYLKQPCCYHTDVTCLHAAPGKAFSVNADTHMTRASWCDLGKQSFPLSVIALVEKSYKRIPGIMILTLMFWEWPYTGSFCFQKKAPIQLHLNVAWNGFRCLASHTVVLKRVKTDF